LPGRRDSGVSRHEIGKASRSANFKAAMRGDFTHRPTVTCTLFAPAKLCNMPRH
jgi:hypothetical protein